MKTLVIVMACAVLMAAPAAQKTKSAPHRVYVFTADVPGGTSPADEKEREDAVTELRDALAKKKGIAVVDDRADSTIQIEVVKCEAVDMGGGGFGGMTVTPLDQKIIHLHAVSPADQADFKGEAPGYWNRAAKDAADRLAKWIRRQ